MEPSWSGEGEAGSGKSSQDRDQKKRREGGESELFLCERAGEKRENGEGGEDLICLCSDPPFLLPPVFRPPRLYFALSFFFRDAFSFLSKYFFFRGNSSGRNRDKVSRGELEASLRPKEPPEARRALRRAGEVSPPPYVAAWGDTAGLRVTGIYDDSGRKGGRGFLVFPHFSSSFSPPLLPASKSAPGKR